MLFGRLWVGPDQHQVLTKRNANIFVEAKDLDGNFPDVRLRSNDRPVEFEVLVPFIGARIEKWNECVLSMFAAANCNAFFTIALDTR